MTFLQNHKVVLRVHQLLKQLSVQRRNNLATYHPNRHFYEHYLSQSKEERIAEKKKSYFIDAFTLTKCIDRVKI